MLDLLLKDQMVKGCGIRSEVGNYAGVGRVSNDIILLNSLESAISQ